MKITMATSSIKSETMKKPSQISFPVPYNPKQKNLNSHRGTGALSQTTQTTPDHYSSLQSDEYLRYLTTLSSEHNLRPKARSTLTDEAACVRRTASSSCKILGWPLEASKTYCK